MIDPSKYFNSVVNDDTVMALHGIFDERRIQEFIRLVEGRLEDLEEDFRLKKKVMNVMVEILQNVYHHANESCPYAINAFFVLNHEPEGYFLNSGNYMSSGNVEKLKTKLDGVNQMSENEIKSEYISTLDTGSFSVKGGAGWGSWDIVRKSGNKVTYKFIEENNFNTFFMLKVKVTG